MSSLANTIRREDEAARRQQAQWEAEAEAAADAYWDAREERRALANDEGDAPKWEAPLAAEEQARIEAEEAELEAELAQDAPARKPAAREDVFAAFRSGAYFGLEVKR